MILWQKHLQEVFMKAIRPGYLLIPLMLFFTVSVSGVQPDTAVSEVPAKVSILFFNDIHGYLEPFTIMQDNQAMEVGGIARIYTLIQTITRENQARQIPTFVLIAGDSKTIAPVMNPDIAIHIKK